PPYKDYARVANADLAAGKALARPAKLRILRNGTLDLHHARGAFSWLNPLESAVALLDGGRYAPSWVDLVGFKLRANGCMDEFPDRYEQLLSCDVLALDDVHSFHLGARRRVMVADFVRAGGGLLYFGGYFNLSLGADHNTYLAELLPVRIRKYHDVLRDDKGLRLKAAKEDFFAGVNFATPVYAFTVDTSPLKDGVDVLATVGGKPAIVGRSCGKGRVITVLMNPCGAPAEGRKPYWRWSQWPKVLAACVRWLGQDAGEKSAGTKARRAIDRTKPTPTELLLAGVDLGARAFTARLTDACRNVVDARSAHAALESVVAHADKIEDPAALAKVLDAVGPLLDKSFAAVGERLAKGEHDFIRRAGFRVLGSAGGAEHRPLLCKGLTEKRPEVAREALVALGRLGDPAAVPAVEAFLKRGQEELLALTVLVRLGRANLLPRALAAYERALTRRVRLKCGRGAAISHLWGGVSFKLTRAQRKRGMAEYRKVLRLEAEAKHDVEYFTEVMKQLPPTQLGPVAEFFAQTRVREAVPLAFALVRRLPAPQAKRFRAKMAAAHLDELRYLAAD
ncbi:MAG TPA: HEAT repeat domain-containing protein, partial [Phycisphaerae bacterium]|nr:HEAT repeat domain-containing protein [Phycisphaerae bacterium]